MASLGWDPCGGAVVLDVLALEGSSALPQVIGVHDSECETLVPEPRKIVVKYCLNDVNCLSFLDILHWISVAQ